MTQLARFTLLTAIVLLCTRVLAQTPHGSVPNVLLLNNGSKVTTVKQWEKQRRPEILQTLTTEMYGVAPAVPKISFEVFDNDNTALDGKATRKQIRIWFNKNKQGVFMDMLLYVPNNTIGKAPVILGLNFNGNHAVTKDVQVRLNANRMDKAKGVVNGRATDSSRGSEAVLWPIETILLHGYAVATIYRGDIAPDFTDGQNEGVQAQYPGLKNRPDNFATIAAWAWGLSRGLDYLLTDNSVDAKSAIVFGFSRLGKAALWAGANDARFKIVISNESGAGGAKLFHCPEGEGITRLTTVFPHWFNNNFKKYAGQDTLLAFDQHMVIALIAPRPVYVASAIDDKNSNPQAEFLGLKMAEPVFMLYGKKGLPADTFPPLNTAVVGDIAYHIRSGGHSVTAYDWQQYLAFIDTRLGRK